MRMISLCLSLLFLLSACNTMQGLGRDIEALGDGIDRTAEDARN